MSLLSAKFRNGQPSLSCGLLSFAVCRKVIPVVPCRSRYNSAWKCDTQWAGMEVPWFVGYVVFVGQTFDLKFVPKHFTSLAEFSASNICSSLIIIESTVEWFELLSRPPVGKSMYAGRYIQILPKACKLNWQESSLEQALCNVVSESSAKAKAILNIFSAYKLRGHITVEKKNAQGARAPNPIPTLLSLRIANCWVKFSVYTGIGKTLNARGYAYLVSLADLNARLRQANSIQAYVSSFQETLIFCVATEGGHFAWLSKICFYDP